MHRIVISPTFALTTVTCPVTATLPDAQLKVCHHEVMVAVSVGKPCYMAGSTSGLARLLRPLRANWMA